MLSFKKSTGIQNYYAVMCILVDTVDCPRHILTKKSRINHTYEKKTYNGGYGFLSSEFRKNAKMSGIYGFLSF